MKIFGLILVFASATAAGFIKAEAYKERDAEISAFIELIYFIKQEISAYLTPQHQIYEKFTCSVLEKNGFLTLLREYSHQGIEAPLMSALDNCGGLTLDTETRDIVAGFAEGFGSLSTADECQRCDRTVCALEEIYKKRREETLEKTRLCRSVGSMIGIGLVLLLW